MDLRSFQKKKKKLRTWQGDPSSSVSRTPSADNLRPYCAITQRGRVLLRDSSQGLLRLLVKHTRTVSV